jgi:hypothetical protein
MNRTVGFPFGVLRNETSMTLQTSDCNFRLVSEQGQHLIDEGNPDALVAFTREVLACPLLRNCEFGDYCTILSASLLAEHDRHPHTVMAD